MSIRAFTVRIDAELVEAAAISSKTNPARFVAGAVATAILDAFDGGSIHVECDNVAITATMEPGCD